MKFLGKEPLSPDEARKLGDYIMLYVKNLACAAWLFSDDRKEYYRYMLPCIRRLSRILPKVKSRKEVWEMLDVCLEYAIDPF